MQSENPIDLEKKAIKAAMAGDWNLAKDINLTLMDLEPQNIDAKIRLGKAYLELQDFTKAKKCFKEVLSVDPINTVAQRNYQMAKDEKHAPIAPAVFKSLIKEPATYAEVQAEIIAKGFTASKFAPGTSFTLKILTNHTKIITDHKGQQVELADITDTRIHKRLKAGKDEGALISATYVKGTDKLITLLLTSSQPIFEGEKQELKPYTKRDFMNSDDEPPEPAIEEN